MFTVGELVHATGHRETLYRIVRSTALPKGSRFIADKVAENSAGPNRITGGPEVFVRLEDADALYAAAMEATRWLLARSTASGLSEMVVGTSDLDGNVVGLYVNDLEVLVRSVLGPVTTRYPRRDGRPVPLPADALERERKAFANAPDEED